MKLPAMMAGLALLLAAGCDDDAAKAPGKLPLVYVAPAVERNVQSSATVIGEVRAVSTVNLVARVDGFMVERNFQEGTMVKAGDVLFRIEPDQYQAALDLAKAHLARAEADLQKTTIDHDRQKDLVEKHAVSEREYDNAAAAKAYSEADVAAAKADVKTAQLNLDYTSVVAPFDGKIGYSAYSVGAMIGPESGALATLVSEDPINVDFNINEIALLEMLGLSREEIPELLVKLEFMDKTGYPLTGKIQSADNRVSASTGSFKIRSVFENPDGKLIPGMYVRVAVVPKTGVPRVLVPQIALASDIKGDYLYCVNADGKVERRDVKPGDRQGAWTVILDGVKAGDSVITSGVQKARVGSAVDAQPDPDYPNPSPEAQPAAAESAA